MANCCGHFMRNINLLNLSNSAWKVFIGLVLAEVLVSVAIFICSLACLGVGLEYAYGYREINCGNALPIWTGLISVITGMFGLFATRALHVRWPTFLYLLCLSLSLVLCTGLIADGIGMTSRWKERSEMTPFAWTLDPLWTPIPTPWNAHNFVVVDSVLVSLVTLNEMILLGKLGLLLFYWIPKQANVSVQTNP